jgi:hypothetical protein
VVGTPKTPTHAKNAPKKHAHSTSTELKKKYIYNATKKKDYTKECGCFGLGNGVGMEGENTGRCGIQGHGHGRGFSHASFGHHCQKTTNTKKQNLTSVQTPSKKTKNPPPIPNIFLGKDANARD